jgi:uncharacterized circularly permuted ATP-grasp superfamily protein
MTAAALGLGQGDVPARSIDGAPGLLRETVRAAAPAGDPFLVVLTDGPTSSAYTEHRVLAEHLGAPLVTSEELALDGDRLVLRDGSGQPVDGVYRRTDDSSLHAPVHRDVIAAMAAGTVGVTNAFGTGVADDKLTHAYVEDLVRLYLGEEPVLPSLRTFDLQRDADREEVLDRLAELVLKPRGGSGGHGVTIGPDADAAALEAARAAVTEAPTSWPRSSSCSRPRRRSPAPRWRRATSTCARSSSSRATMRGCSPEASPASRCRPAR